MSLPYSLTIGGEAGNGVMSAGETLAKLATRSGYRFFAYSEYPSLIRGGHNSVAITIDTEPVHAQHTTINLLIALNQETIHKHRYNLAPRGIIILDRESGMHVPGQSESIHICDVPINRLARDAGGSYLMRNTVAIGAAAAIIGADLDLLHALIEESFAGKAADIIARNINALDAGYTHVKEHCTELMTTTLAKQPDAERPMVVTGNEAIALGAIAGGMQFASIYPMTPTSSILHTLAPLQETHKFIYEQPEDEIAAINMAIGASFAGARSMVATAGGGFCLMAEGYGLAGMTETPVVAIVGMRGGPATGLPTWTEQGDLRFILHAHQGDFPRIVLAASDVSDAFALTAQAFALADKYQTPVAILVDKYLCESTMCMDKPAVDPRLLDRGNLVTKPLKKFARYTPTPNGISPRAIPGSGNFFIANSDEHDAAGYSDESAKNRVEQMEKRMKKLATCHDEDMAPPTLYGPKRADITIVSWGSTKGPILEALKHTTRVNYLHVTWMNPFPSDAVRAILSRARHIIDIECNYSAPLAGLIREKTGIEIIDTLLKYDGRPFYPEEIREKIDAVKQSRSSWKFWPFS